MINKIILVGRITKDVEIRYTQSGTAMANFTVATNHKYKDKSGNYKDNAEFTKCVAFGRVGEVACENLSKGSLVYVEGRLQTRKWEQDGATKYMTEAVIEKLQFLDRKSTDSRHQPGNTIPDNDPPF